MPYKPIDNTYLLTSVESLLTHTRDSHTARPDVYTLVPFVRDVVLEEVVIHCRGNQAKAARMLGIHRSTLRTHLRRIQRQKSPQRKLRANIERLRR